MADTLGEDRLLDEVEAALKEITQWPWVCAPWSTGQVAPACWLESKGTSVATVDHDRDKRFIAHAPDWLARLCARVRHLEAERDELLKARSIWDTSITAAWKAEQETRAASQRLTEANARLLELLKALHHTTSDWIGLEAPRVATEGPAYRAMEIARAHAMEELRR